MPAIKAFVLDESFYVAPRTAEYEALERDARARGIYGVTRARSHADVRKLGGRYALVRRDSVVHATDTPEELRRFLRLSERS